MKVVREMYGLMTAENASSVEVISSGMFTQEAKNFAEGKPIDLIDGGQLLRMVEGVRAQPDNQGIEEPTIQEQILAECPRCGSELVERVARRGNNAGKKFIGCSGFPKCRYTQSAFE